VSSGAPASRAFAGDEPDKAFAAMTPRTASEKESLDGNEEIVEAVPLGEACRLLSGSPEA